MQHIHVPPEIHICNYDIDLCGHVVRYWQPVGLSEMLQACGIVSTRYNYFCMGHPNMEFMLLFFPLFLF